MALPLKVVLVRSSNFWEIYESDFSERSNIKVLISFLRFSFDFYEEGINQKKPINRLDSSITGRTITRLKYPNSTIGSITNQRSTCHCPYFGKISETKSIFTLEFFHVRTYLFFSFLPFDSLNTRRLKLISLLCLYSGATESPTAIKYFSSSKVRLAFPKACLYSSGVRA